MLSIICPSIRIDNLPKLYESINNSYSGEFEFIVISPYEETFHWPNMKWIRDWGSPLRCQCIGLANAKGEYITRAVDDGIYLKDSLNKAISLIENDNDVVCMKFVEGTSSHLTFKDEFYKLSYHIQSLRPYVPYNAWLINFGIYPTKLLRELGGWDAQTFESIALGDLDLSIRLYWSNANIKITDKIVIMCQWEPGIEGTHAPVHYSCIRDQKVYDSIYSSYECENRIKIDIDNWKRAPEKWIWRFPNV